MTTATLPRRRYSTTAPIDAMLLPDGVELPEPVSTAREQARETFDAWRAACHEVHEAKLAVKAGPRADPKLEGRLAKAQRAQDVAYTRALEAFFDQRDAIVEDRPAIVAARWGDRGSGRQDRQGARRGRRGGGGAALRAGAARGDRARPHVARQHGLRTPGGDTPSARRRRERIEEVERQRPQARGDSRLNVPREVDNLRVALRVAVEEEIGKEPDPAPAQSLRRAGCRRSRQAGRWHRP